MTNTRFILPFAIVFILLTALLQTLFVVGETQQALIMQFGKNVRTIHAAGLYAKIPFLQQVEYFERRVLDVDPEPERVILASTDSGFMATLVSHEAKSDENASEDFNSGSPFIVDTFARYRITDPLKFRQRLDSEEGARLRISNEMESTTRDVLGRSTIEQLLSKSRTKLMEQIKQRVNKAVSDFGVEIVDVRINRADLTSNLKEATFNRMRSEREQRAAEIRSMGEKRGLEIRSNADKDRTVLLAEAERQAQFLRGTADREASNVYAGAYQKDADFYGFYRSLQAYRQSLGREDATMVLPLDNAFFNTMRSGK